MKSAVEIKLFAGHSSQGNPVCESLLAYEVGDKEFQLAVSPALVIGVAAGDMVRLLSQSAGSYELVKRGGNLAVQLYGRDLDQIHSTLTTQITKIGGVLDGVDKKVLVYTIPVSAGFNAIEKLLNEFVKNNPSVAWYYGNVYDDDGFTPLNWW